MLREVASGQESESPHLAPQEQVPAVDRVGQDLRCRDQAWGHPRLERRPAWADSLAPDRQALDLLAASAPLASGRLASGRLALVRLALVRLASGRLGSDSLVADHTGMRQA